MSFYSDRGYQMNSVFNLSNCDSVEISNCSFSTAYNSTVDKLGLVISHGVYIHDNNFNGRISIYLGSDSRHVYARIIDNIGLACYYGRFIETTTSGTGTYRCIFKGNEVVCIEDMLDFLLYYSSNNSIDTLEIIGNNFSQEHTSTNTYGTSEFDFQSNDYVINLRITRLQGLEQAYLRKMLIV